MCENLELIYKLKYLKPGIRIRPFYLVDQDPSYILYKRQKHTNSKTTPLFVLQVNTPTLEILLLTNIVYLTIRFFVDVEIL